MKKELCILLLIFIAAVGFSGAVSAAPVAKTTQGTTISHGVHHSGDHWTVITRFHTMSYKKVRDTINQYNPKPPYKVTVYVRWVHFGHFSRQVWYVTVLEFVPG